MKPLGDMPDDLDDDSDGVSTTTSISESHEGSIGTTEGGAYLKFSKDCCNVQFLLKSYCSSSSQI